MLFKCKKPVILLLGVLLLVSMTPAFMVANCERTSAFQAQYGVLNHKVYVSVTPSLYDYYGNMSNAINSDSDYANLVTPQAVESIAENIQNLTSNLSHSNERFADAVLQLVHQIPYAINDPKYPVQTLVDNNGDCVSLSLLAASIMQAAGLDVVLIDYTGINPGHMNVGVYLPYMPFYHTAGEAPTDFVYNNKTYWTAECTPAENWKLGDQWNALAKANATIIPLENAEQSSPGQISSSLNTPLTPSSITIDLSQDQSFTNTSQVQSSLGENLRALTISGFVSPANSGENVSIYVSSQFSHQYFTTVTNSSGGYVLTWNFTSAGTYYIRTSWSGDSNYAGADSQTLTVFAGPESAIQFSTHNYNYIFAQPAYAAYQIQSLYGINDFLSIPLGRAVSFSYDFTIVQAGQTGSNVQTEATLQSPMQFARLDRNFTLQQLPPQIFTEPVNVPAYLSPILLPSDFNQTINNQFCFIFQNNRGNYSLNVNALNDYNVSDVKQGNENTASFLNASESIQENVWYNVTASVSDSAITANLYDTNGTLTQSMVTPTNSTDSNQAVMLIANNADSAVIFKDLTVKTANITTQLPESNSKTTDYVALLLPYVGASIFLIAASTVIAVHFKKKKTNQAKNGDDAAFTRT